MSALGFLGGVASHGQRKAGEKQTCGRRVDLTKCRVSVDAVGSDLQKSGKFEEDNGIDDDSQLSESRYLEKVLTARVYDVAIESALEDAPLLSGRVRNRILLKREDTQPVFSFKLRGAYNMMAKTPYNLIKNGVVAASAGNHAQGVALGAQTLGVPATIVMPSVTPAIKVEAVKRRGGTAILHGRNFDEAKAKAEEISKETGALYVPPFDHPEVIAGQGTIGLEILRQRSDHIDAIFIPIGGGGLIAGIATVVKRLRPEIKIIGVEPFEADAMKRSIDKGERVKLNRVGTFADGVAVIEVGEETFRLCKDLIDEIVLVDREEICASIKDMFEDTRSILEPSGALSVAGAKRYIADNDVTDQTFVAITSGANMNFDRLRYVSEMAEIGEQREAIFAVKIPERAGSFKELIRNLKNANITEFNYRFACYDEASVFVGVGVSGPKHAKDIFESLQSHYQTLNLTHDDMTKLHMRHLVGAL
uniref:Threonine dehydratase n=1 Tax=Rhodosorus marinus TaxID=101924 RepID=A0A7S2ZPS6_9RHOD|mmetsp:Transcript_27663/g.108500  ORF Transcript_27663/g.108500 Transcript_27663/m.108500 type:complete len:477 (+) Transcript_27663:142-1572(+)